MYLKEWNGITIKATTTKHIKTENKFTIQTPKQTYTVVAIKNNTSLQIQYKSKLYKECLKCLFKLIKKQKTHLLGFNWYLLAREYEVQLTEADSWLKPIGKTKFNHISKQAKVLRGIPDYLKKSLPKILNLSQPNLYEEWVDFEGYSWYDSLPKYQYEGLSTKDCYVWFRNIEDNHLLNLYLPLIMIPKETVETHEVYCVNGGKVNMKLLIDLLIKNDKSERAKDEVIKLALKRAQEINATTNCT